MMMENMGRAKMRLNIGKKTLIRHCWLGRLAPSFLLLDGSVVLLIPRISPAPPFSVSQFAQGS
jgi:hypothetical protein